MPSAKTPCPDCGQPKHNRAARCAVCRVRYDLAKIKEERTHPNPSGLCMCGCGLRTPIAKSTSSGRSIKGEPYRYLPQHQGRRGTAIERFWSHVEKSSGCWTWTAGRNRAGYGTFSLFGQSWLAHRFAYITEVGAIPLGLQLDHLCRNTSCVRPDHLEPVTARVNLLRSDAPTARKARQTHCIRGHAFTPENTIVRRDGRGRECRSCGRLSTERYLQRKRQQFAPVDRRRP